MTPITLVAILGRLHTVHKCKVENCKSEMGLIKCLHTHALQLLCYMYYPDWFTIDSLEYDYRWGW